MWCGGRREGRSVHCEVWVGHDLPGPARLGVVDEIIAWGWRDEASMRVEDTVLVGFLFVGL